MSFENLSGIFYTNTNSIIHMFYPGINIPKLPAGIKTATLKDYPVIININDDIISYEIHFDNIELLTLDIINSISVTDFKLVIFSRKQ
jgi:hypothetical protein